MKNAFLTVILLMGGFIQGARSGEDFQDESFGNPFCKGISFAPAESVPTFILLEFPGGRKERHPVDWVKLTESNIAGIKKYVVRFDFGVGALIIEGGKEKWDESYSMVLDAFEGQVYRPSTFKIKNHPRDHLHLLGEGIFVEPSGMTVKVKGTFHINQVFNGNLKIRALEDHAVLTGVLGRGSYKTLKEFMEKYPHIDTLILRHMPGSIDSHKDMATVRLAKERGFTMIIPSDGFVASGAVYFFSAAKVKIVEKGGRVAVHPWRKGYSSGADSSSSNEPTHNFYRCMLTGTMGAKGRSFYHYTLQASSDDHYHVMTRKELRYWFGIE